MGSRGRRPGAVRVPYCRPMQWALAVIALSLIGFGMVSRRVDGTSVTPAIVFVGVGLVVGAKHSISSTCLRPARR